MKRIATLLLACLASLAQAETPQQIRTTYANEAAATQPGFTPSAARGERFFRQSFAVTEKMPACSSCHTDNPVQPGEHVVTGKRIRPLSVAGDSQRFSDPAKVEKWFGRNCREVVGRACSPAEKADFVAYMSEVR